MTNSTVAELYFIAGMMVLILIICVASTYIFIRQYRREKGSGKPDSPETTPTPDKE